ncbi:mitochondrial 37S ribosomal protein mS37 [Dipodascopsis tothii]|uniref:mitochondrial 37S ribosomal protein mS37 n=1 Tax=Dipodascopsis tothii TaxID=44089 RepID=UPI0034CFBCCB
MSSKNAPLPKLKYLKVKRPFRKEPVDKCAVMMRQLLTCWTSNGLGSPACAQFEAATKSCYDTSVAQASTRTSFNYHAARLFPKFNGGGSK